MTTLDAFGTNRHFETLSLTGDGVSDPIELRSNQALFLYDVEYAGCSLQVNGRTVWIDSPMVDTTSRPFNLLEIMWDRGRFDRKHAVASRVPKDGIIKVPLVPKR